MSLIKNTAGQFLYAVLVNSTNGAAITTGATLSIAKDGAAAGAAGASLTHRTGGMWEAALSQADTNGNNIGYVWGGTNVIPQGGTIVTVDYPRNAIPNILAAITSSGVAISAATMQALADEWLNRNMALGTDTGTEVNRTVRQALRALRNKWDFAGAAGAYQVYKEDDVTVNWTGQPGTNASADPLVSMDPTST